MRNYVLSALIWLAIPPALLWAGQQSPQRSSDLLPRISLGVAVAEMPSEGAHGGVIVRHLTAGGPAARAGLQKGDIIVRVSNRRVDDFDELLSALSGHKPGEQLTFTVLRDREPKNVQVTLGEPTKGEKKQPEGCHKCAFLGVLTLPIEALSEDAMDRLGLVDERGLVVLDVVPGSPAAQAGLRHGDLLQSINDKEIHDPDTLRTQIHQAGTGKEVRFKVRRGEHVRGLSATLTEGPCDVLLVVPPTSARTGGEASGTIERLERRIEFLEKRLKELESKRTPGQPR